MARKNVPKTYTDERGKFAQGNPGRPKGARHRMTHMVEDLLGGDVDKLTRKAVEMALAGDARAMRLCLERIMPPRKDTPVTFDLPPIESARDAAGAAQSVLKEVSDGHLTPLEGAAVMALVEVYRKTLETTEFEDRISALEKDAWPIRALERRIERLERLEPKDEDRIDLILNIATGPSGRTKACMASFPGLDVDPLTSRPGEGERGFLQRVYATLALGACIDHLPRTKYAKAIEAGEALRAAREVDAR